MTLSIIIVNYSVYDLLKNCINSIYANVSGVEYEIIVADNHSPERNIDSIKNDLPEVRYISLQDNLGFAKANNIAASEASGTYLLFLNPDTILTENFIPNIINFMNENYNAGVCAPQLLFSDNSFQSSTGPQMGLFYDFLESYGLVGFYRKFTSTKYLSNLNKPYEVGWASAACFFIKRANFEAVSGFTEEYFLNYEDIDICTKISKLGFDIIYLPKYKCIHLDHKSFNTDYELLVFSRYASRLKFTRLHYTFSKYALSRLILISGIFLKLLFVNIAYSSQERRSRRKGYIRSLKLYAGIE